jgi:ABC-2 type transport system permease protein
MTQLTDLPPTTDLPQPTAGRTAPLLPALTQLTLAELRRMLRNPMFAAGTVGFPILFFALFGLPAVREVTEGGVNVGQIILVRFGIYSLLSLAMFSFGSGIAAERVGGWLRLLRASPMPSALFFAAKVLAALLFSTLALAALYAFAHFAGGVTMGAGLALLTLGKLLLGMVPLIALGLAVGFVANPQAAQITAQLVSVIMAFASGLFISFEGLPSFVRGLAPWLPAYHLGQIGVGTVAGQGAQEPGHWLALLAFTAVFGIVALRGMQRDESREG